MAAKQELDEMPATGVMSPEPQGRAVETEEVADDGDAAAAWQASAHAGPEPLPADVAARMGDRLGADLSDVRVHAGPAGAERAHAHQARAVTEGSDIAFAPGEYAPGTGEGDHLLAHELAHVVQQRGGNAGPQAKRHDGGGVPALEAEADRAAAAVVSGADATVGAAPPGLPLLDKLPVPLPVPPTFKFDFTAGPRHRLHLIRAELRQAETELELVSGPRMFDAAVHALARAADELEGLAFMAKVPALREGLQPLARSVASQMNRLLVIMPPLTGAPFGKAMAALEAAMGEKIVGERATSWGVQGAPYLDPSDRKAVIAEALVEAGGLIAGALSAPRDQERRAPAGALGKLSAIDRLLADTTELDRTARAELIPAVQAVSNRALDLRFQCSEPLPASVRELLIRLSQVRCKVGIGDWQMAMNGETMADLRRGYDPKDGDRFDELIGRLGVSIRASYRIRQEGVTDIQTMKDAKDPPVVRNHMWRDLAIFAVKLAAGPAVEAIIGGLTPGEAGPWKDKTSDTADKRFPGAAEHGGEGALLKLFTKAVEKVVEKKVIEPLTETKEAAAEGPDVNVELFFGAQRTLLDVEGARAEADLIGELANHKSMLAENPRAVLGELESLVARYGVLDGGKGDSRVGQKIQESQWDGTTAAYVRLLAIEGVKSTLEAKDKAGEINAEVRGTSYTAPEWEGEGVDLKRMLGISNGQMDLNAGGLINLEYTVDLRDPGKRVELRQAWIFHIGPHLRGILEKRPLAGLGIPIRARGGPIATPFGSAFAMVGKSDSGAFSARGAPDEFGPAETWLVKKGDGRPGEDRKAAMERAAQKIIDDELCSRSIESQLGPGSLDPPK